EEGIRDGHVTGVQTCALPISFVYGALPSTTIIPLGVSRAPYTNEPSPGSSTSFVSSPWKDVTAPGPVSATTPASTRETKAPVYSAVTSVGVTSPGSTRAICGGPSVIPQA